MFDSLPLLSAPEQHELCNELDRYLNTDPKAVGDVLMWWHEHCMMYPYLSHMALDYLAIPGVFFNYSGTSVSSGYYFLPATSVDVKQIFSHGHLVLSHVCGQLSAQLTWALLCLGSWSLLGLVKDTDVLAVTVLDDVEGDEELELNDGWDSILQ
jgi:hAT family C-terminal dimerisation region